MSGSPLKVLYVIHDARRGGVQSVMLRVIAALDRHRVELTVLFPFDGPCAVELRRQGVTVHTGGDQTPFFWRLKRFLIIPRLIDYARQADLVHLNSTKLAPAALAVSLAGARTVFHLHELAEPVGPLLRAAIGRADCVAFCSQTCADHYAGVAAHERRLLLNAVPIPEPLPKRRSAGVPRLVMIGSINAGKGQDLLLDAFALVRRPAELHFYGNVGLSARGYAEQLAKRAAEPGLAGRVFFHPPTDDVGGVLAESDVLVHTSRRESFGLVLAEAMAAGLPVIAHDLGGMREVVADGLCGFLVPPGDAKRLSERIDELLADPVLRQRLGRAGRELARQRFDIAARIGDYHALYEELTGTGGNG